MPFSDVQKIGRPGPVNRKFDLLDFALNNGYRVFDVSFFRDNSADALLKQTHTYLCNNNRLNGISINSVSFPLYDVMCQVISATAQGSARADNGEVDWLVRDLFSTNKPATTLFNRASVQSTAVFIGNTTCANADTANLSISPGIWSVYQPTATVGNFEFQIRHGWGKNVAGGAICSGSIAATIRVFVKSGLYLAQSAGAGQTITELT